ncbi:MAG: sigma-70 family RNA polymerase sigma factor [Planctomycetota bacterium]
MNDRAALRRYARRGDPAAFEVLAQRYHRMVLATCRRSLRDESDAEDAAQETFLKLSQHAGVIRSNVGAWLHAAAMGTSIDIARRDASRRRTERGAASAAEASSDGSESALLWRDIEPMIDDALAALAESDRELIVGRFLAGRTQRELAREAGISDGTMHRRINRALDRLRLGLNARGLAIGGIAGLGGSLGYASASAPHSAIGASIAKIGLAGVGRATSTGGAKALAAAAIVLLGTGGVIGASMLARGHSGGLLPAFGLAAGSAEPGPERVNGRIGPFVIVSATDAKFSDRGVWMTEDRMSIRHGVTQQGEPIVSVLRVDRRVPTEDDPDTARIDARVEQISPIGLEYGRFELGQRVRFTAGFDDAGRIVLTPDPDGPQFGRNEPRWFGVRPPRGWPEHGRIPEDAGPFGIDGPWTEAERIPVTITGREVRFGTDRWQKAIYRIVEWTPVEGHSRILSVHAGGRDPRLIGTRFKLIIREDDDGYTIGYFPIGTGREDDFPGSFEYSPEHPVRVVNFERRDG